MKNDTLQEAVWPGALTKSALALGTGGILTKAVTEKFGDKLGPAPEPLLKLASAASKATTGEPIEENTANTIMNSGKNTGKVLGAAAIGGGLYTLKKLKDKVQDTAENISQQQDHLAAATKAVVGENVIVLEPKELVEAMFDLPETTSSYKERIQESSFNSFNKYITKVK